MGWYILTFLAGMWVGSAFGFLTFCLVALKRNKDNK